MLVAALVHINVRVESSVCTIGRIYLLSVSGFGQVSIFSDEDVDLLKLRDLSSSAIVMIAVYRSLQRTVYTCCDVGALRRSDRAACRYFDWSSTCTDDGSCERVLHCAV